LRNKAAEFFLVFLLFTAPVIGQTNYDAQITRGLNLSYNFQFSEAEKAFSLAMQTSPERPEAYHYTAQLHLWSFLGSKDNSELKIFYRWSDIASDKAETLLKNSKNDPKLHYLTGNIYLLRAMALGAEKSNFKAFGAVKSAYSHFEESLELKRDMYDCYRGMGLLHYALDYIPGILKLAVSIGGIKPDRERGMNYVRLAYNKGAFDREESAFHLAKLYTDYAGENDSAFAVLKPLLNRFPENPVFNYEAAVILIKTGQMADAEKFINKVISQNHESVRQMNALARFLKGDIYFKRNDFAAAEKCYWEFLDKTLDADYTGIANLRLAYCLFFQGKKDLYRKALNDARSGNTDIFEDEYAKEISEQMNGRDLFYEETILIKAENDFDNRKYQDVIEALTSAPGSITVNDNKALANLLIAESLLELNRTDEAEKYLAVSESYKPSDSKWIIPKRWYVKASIEVNRGNLKKGMEYLDNAFDENDYGFRDEIEAMLNKLKSKILKK
jgi:predicted negative regulator of RcsB-dependent stress response